MKNKKWEVIHEIYARMERLYGKSLCLPEEFLFEGSLFQKKSTGEENEPRKEFSIEDIIEVRADLRNQLDILKIVLSDLHNERETYMILFPVVAHIDEIIQNNVLSTVEMSWPPLQKELFQIENAGEVFYEILEDIINKNQTPNSIYEVYYFCLHYGFRGRYENNPAKIIDYMNLLREKLKVNEEIDISTDAESIGQVKKIIRPHWYYLSALGVFLLVYILLYIVAKNI